MEEAKAGITGDDGVEVDCNFPPAVPEDILGALLFARVDGRLPQSLSQTVGDVAGDTLPEETDSSVR